MTDQTQPSKDFGWSHEETRRRQIQTGAQMTPAERLAWLEEMLDELLPLLGRARSGERMHERGRT